MDCDCQCVALTDLCVGVWIPDVNVWILDAWLIRTNGLYITYPLHLSPLAKGTRVFCEKAPKVQVLETTEPLSPEPASPFPFYQPPGVLLIGFRGGRRPPPQPATRRDDKVSSRTRRNFILHENRTGPFLFGGSTRVMTALEPPGSDDRKFLVLLNPKSGPGKAREMFQQRVVPVLAEAELAFDLYVTKHANYARDFVRLKDVYQWRGVVVVGGDGIVFEVYNGLLEREDWQKALNEVPVGVIPCGSGNGLAKSISHSVDEPYDQNPVLISSLNVIKCRTVPMDLVRVETKTQIFKAIETLRDLIKISKSKILFSFLSVGWGFLSDIDIESERLRVIGGQRFTLWSVARLIGLRTYRGKLWFLPLAGYDHALTSNGVGKLSAGQLKRSSSHMVESGNKSHQVFPESSFTPVHGSLSYHDCISQNPHGFEGEFQIQDSLTLETLGQGSDEGVYGEAGDLTNNNPRQRLDSYYSATSRRSTYFSMTGSTYQSLVDSASQTKQTSNGTIEPRRANSNIQMYGPPSQLTGLMQPVPDHWVCIEGEFVMVHAAYQSHLSNDCFFAPNSKLADGIIWLVVIRAGISRGQLLQKTPWQQRVIEPCLLLMKMVPTSTNRECHVVSTVNSWPLIQFLLGLSSGSHLQCAQAEMIPVTAFRLEPAEGTTGHMTVDGESVDYGPLQAELMPSLAHIMSR
uniref:sphingosine kinase n=1 Tax=Timema shepardi TaxID=629360 RepID=A0A7R9APJ3_TIMSH|nr:unnamed protein product [Timema shepardi]